MRQFCFLALIAVLAACSGQKGDTFEARGTIEDAADSMLYMDAITLRGPVTIDSVKLTAEGSFAMHGARPSNPEFYRLRLGGEVVNFSIDSTETVTFTAKRGHMATGYKVALMQLQLRRDAQALATRDGMSPSQRQAAWDSRLASYKQTVIDRYVAPDQAAAVAYYAMFQTFGGSLIFDPVNNRREVRWFGAVATAWDALYPGTERTENLHNVTLGGMANTRQKKGLPIKFDQIEETGIIDMTLTDPNGNEHSLSDLKGKVVLLDFTAYAAPENGARTLALRELYDKYAARGLEIYQVSVDEDLHLWRMRADALPWTTVHIGEKTDILVLYQVEAVPTFFLIDRGSNLVSRDKTMTDLDAEITKLL